MSTASLAVERALGGVSPIAVRFQPDTAWTLPPEIADRILDALETDFSYRQRFTMNPRLALAEMGFTPAADPAIAHDQGMWRCFVCSKLPSPEEIGTLRAALREELVGTADHQIFNRG